MPPWLDFLAAVLLLAIGIRLSAFFSGSETGFHRVSYLRLTAAAHDGDPAARRILRFVRNPAEFTATTLVGNTTATLITAAGVVFLARAMSFGDSVWAAVIAALALLPFAYLFGELLPKNLNNRAPFHMLRNGSRWFLLAHRLLLPVSWPLILLSRAVQRGGAADPEAPLALALGRTRLVQVLKRGHAEGLLTDAQSRLVGGLLQTAPLPVIDSAIPLGRILGVDDETPRDGVLDFARRFGVSSVMVRTAGSTDGWYGYVRIADLMVTNWPVSLLTRPMPRVEATASRLEAIQILRQNGAQYGVVYRRDRVVGAVSEHGLVEQLFRTPHTLDAPLTPAHHR